jgi:hypothetical protein
MNGLNDHRPAQKHLFVGSDTCKSHPHRISYLRPSLSKGFWATLQQARVGPLVNFQGLRYMRGPLAFQPPRARFWTVTTFLRGAGGLLRQLGFRF